MKVVDLVGEYVSHGLYQHDYTSYERVYPALFKHYFSFWAPHERLPSSVNSGRLLVQRECILAGLPYIEQAYYDAGFDLRDLVLILFVGVGTSNGNAFKEKGKYIVWLPVETYSTSAAVRIFVTHEIAHALHYEASPKYYFDSPDEKDHTGRLLVTEGTATYVTQKVLDVEDVEALWADYLLPGQVDHWLRLCESHEQPLVDLCITHFDDASQRELFQANDQNDIFRYRSGYYIGHKVIEMIVESQKLTLGSLLAMKRKKLDELVLQTLRHMREGG